MELKQTGKFIAELRKEKGLTQQELAEKLNVTDKAVSRWETGRGLPDADSMLAISGFFGVTINELLGGKRIPTPDEARKEEARLAADYIKEAAEKRRYRLLTVLAVIWGALNCVCLSVFLLIFGSAAPFVYKDIMGSPDCVIAKDYSYITLYGKKFVPFDIGDNVCEPGGVLVGEARVEGANFLTKLMFYDRIRLVNGCDDADFVYLESEYDAPSDYYCLETAVEKYAALSNAPKNTYVAQIAGHDYVSYDVILDGEIVSAVVSRTKNDVREDVGCDTSHAKSEYSVTVYAKSDHGPFRRAAGEIIKKNGDYFYFDYSDIPKDQNNADYSGIFAYDLPDGINEKINGLFERILK